MSSVTLPETNLAPENGWLEDGFPCDGLFSGGIMFVSRRVTLDISIWLALSGLTRFTCPQPKASAHRRCRAASTVRRISSRESGCNKYSRIPGVRNEKFHQKKAGRALVFRGRLSNWDSLQYLWVFKMQLLEFGWKMSVEYRRMYIYISIYRMYLYPKLF